MFTPDTTSTQFHIEPPYVVLPVGICTAVAPRVEWRASVDSNAFEVLITRDASSTAPAVWSSGQVQSSATFTQISAPLPTHAELYCHVRIGGNGTWSAWSSKKSASLFRIEPITHANGNLTTYDLQYTRGLTPQLAFEHAHFVAALQGLVNREQPSLYVNFIKSDGIFPDGNVDRFWLKRLREPNGWLSAMNLATEDNLTSMVTRFRKAINGVVVWDSKVPATSAVASTVSGADNLLPVMRSTDPNSLFMQLVESGPRLPIVVDLTGKFTGAGTIWETTRTTSGSAKCDAYLWAMEKYLRSGKCDPSCMGYYIDGYWIRNPLPGGNLQNHTLTNHDYFISKKGFFWDLHVFGDEAPVDDPGQKPGTDLATLKEILKAALDLTGGKKFIHVGGFTPWAFKYTDHVASGGKHDGVKVEWETCRVLSAYNAYVDADALGLGAMANASVLTHMPVAKRYVQPASLTPGELRTRGLLTADNKVASRNYLLHYVGDYDAASWTWSVLTSHWEHPDRGHVTMSYAVNPNLVDRAAPFFEHAYRTRTAQDYFMSGDSGAGYVNPTQLIPPRDPSQAPDSSREWQSHCIPYYSQFGISTTGFLINGRAGAMTPAAEEMYLPFSVNGIVNQYDPAKKNYVHLTKDRMPVFMMQWDLGGNPETDTKVVHERARTSEPTFLVFRTILQPIDYYRKLNALLARERPDLNYEFLDCTTFGSLARHQFGGRNHNFASYLFDTLRSEEKAGTVQKFKFAVRNDGWDTWTKTSGHELQISLAHTPQDLRTTYHLGCEEDVPPGGCALFLTEIKLPTAPGSCILNYQMAHSGISFSANGVPPASTTFQIIP